MSPVRSQPSSVNASAVASGLRQYPWKTFGTADLQLALVREPDLDEWIRLARVSELPHCVLGR